MCVCVRERERVSECVRERENEGKIERHMGKWRNREKAIDSERMRERDAEGVTYRVAYGVKERRVKVSVRKRVR